MIHPMIMQLRKKIRRTPVPHPPKTVERQYYADLRPMVKELIRLTQEKIIPSIDQIAKHAQSLRPKNDSLIIDDYSDDIERLFSSSRTGFLKKYPPSVAAILARKIAHRTDLFNIGQFNRVFGTVLGQEPVRYEPWLQQEINGFVKTNVRLISSIHENYFKKVEDIILRGVRRGTLTDTIAGEIQDEFGIIDRRAKLIARDQVSKFNGDLTQFRQKSVGVTRYRWSTSHDERVRESHQAFDEEVIAWDNPPSSLNGYAWEGHPGEPINCRCVVIPVFIEQD